MLRQVLQEFEAANGAVSLAELSRKLNIRESLLSSMLDFWVRQGALQESGNEQGSCPPSCGGCAIRQVCGFKAKAYSLAVERPLKQPSKN
ncbi:MAG: hypothetical protein J0I20_36060 [Chloroflexi bacterium]|nr:hypothetical protein [Chloroflexota bacterium]OJW06812.1 MAG: hypothetical protein BGO39_23750 [Chloroflexi bacterium 54-19]